jgi:hypothetical protein
LSSNRIGAPLGQNFHLIGVSIAKNPARCRAGS